MIPYHLPKPTTLYQLVDDMMALIETMESVQPEDEAAFLEQFAATLTAQRSKVDNVSRYITNIESVIAAADAEIQRLQERKRTFQNTLTRLEGYVQRVIEMQGLAPDGKPLKLEGNTVTFSLRRCPDKLEVLDKSLIPNQFKRIIVEMTAADWKVVHEVLSQSLSGKGVLHDAKVETCVEAMPAKAALKAGVEVPGATLAPPHYSLVRK